VSLEDALLLIIALSDAACPFSIFEGTSAVVSMHDSNAFLRLRGRVESFVKDGMKFENDQVISCSACPFC
jgi:hypothetical protein